MSVQLAWMVVSRLLRGVFTLWLALTFVFIASRATGDPTIALVPPNVPEVQRQELRELLGLNRHLVVQYVEYLSAVCHGKFGVSFFSGRPVQEVFLERLPNTLALTRPAFVVSMILGISIGVVAAMRRNSRLERAMLVTAVLSQAVPSFLVGMACLVIFSLWLHVLPSSGTGSWKNMLLPIVTLVLANTAVVARLMRASMLDELNKDYIRFAQSTGLSPLAAVLKHGLRNALVPVLTIAGLQFGALISGAIVVETIFSWPGSGRLIIDAVAKRDYPLLQFGILAFALMVIVANTLVDIGQAWLDPRTRSHAA